MREHTNNQHPAPGTNQCNEPTRRTQQKLALKFKYKCKANTRRRGRRLATARRGRLPFPRLVWRKARAAAFLGGGKDVRHLSGNGAHFRIQFSHAILAPSDSLCSEAEGRAENPTQYQMRCLLRSSGQKAPHTERKFIGAGVAFCPRDRSKTPSPVPPVCKEDAGFFACALINLPCADRRAAGRHGSARALNTKRTFDPIGAAVRRWPVSRNGRPTGRQPVLSVESQQLNTEGRPFLLTDTKTEKPGFPPGSLFGPMFSLARV